MINSAGIQNAATFADTTEAQFRAVIDRARNAQAPNAAMLAQIASQARVLLGR